LIHHQNKRFLWNRGFLWGIHFAETLLTPQRLNLLRPKALL
jgi:hypothetical protein